LWEAIIQIVKEKSDEKWNVEPGSIILEIVDKLENLGAEPEMMGPQNLEELDSDFTVEIQENPMKMKNNCPGCDGILAKHGKSSAKIRKEWES
jgi:hypothetical protein